jgi:hypothetical protein
MRTLPLNMCGRGAVLSLSRVWKAQADPGRDPRYEVAGQVSGGNSGCKV